MKIITEKQKRDVDDREEKKTGKRKSKKLEVKKCSFGMRKE